MQEKLLLERLREMGADGVKAADEIERLRGLLVRIADWANCQDEDALPDCFIFCPSFEDD